MATVRKPVSMEKRKDMENGTSTYYDEPNTHTAPLLGDREIVDADAVGFDDDNAVSAHFRAAAMGHNALPCTHGAGTLYVLQLVCCSRGRLWRVAQPLTCARDLPVPHGGVA